MFLLPLNIKDKFVYLPNYDIKDLFTDIPEPAFLIVWDFIKDDKDFAFSIINLVKHVSKSEKGFNCVNFFCEKDLLWLSNIKLDTDIDSLAFDELCDVYNNILVPGSKVIVIIGNSGITRFSIKLNLKIIFLSLILGFLLYYFNLIY